MHRGNARELNTLVSTGTGTRHNGNGAFNGHPTAISCDYKEHAPLENNAHLMEAR